MSLTARIVVDPSRSIAWAQRWMPLSGIALAVFTLVSRWPGLAAAWIALAGLSVVAIVVFDGRRTGNGRPMTLDVSARSDVDLRIGIDAGTYRLGESTVVWPGFAMLALARDGASRTVVRRAVVMGEVHPIDRRALQRFLLWSLRARGSSPVDRKPGA